MSIFSKGWAGLFERVSKQSDYLPFEHFIDDEAVLLRSGGMMSIVEVDGLAFETRSVEEVEAQKDGRAVLLKSMADSRNTLTHIMMRGAVPAWKPTGFRSAFARDLHERWAHVQKNHRYFRNRHFLCVTRYATGLGVTRGFQKKKESPATETAKEQRKMLADVVSSVCGMLEAYRPRVLRSEDARLALYSFCNAGEERGRLQEETGPLREYLPAKTLIVGNDTAEFRGNNASDTQRVKVFTIKEYAGQTHPDQLYELLGLPYPIMISQSFRFSESGPILMSLQKKVKRMKKDHSAATTAIAELDETIDGLMSGYLAVGTHSWTVMARGRTQAELDGCESEINQSLQGSGIIGTKEYGFGLEAAAFSMVPGNEHLSVAPGRINTANLASFISLHNFPVGDPSGGKLGEPIIVLPHKSGAPYEVPLFVEGVGHWLIQGPNGSGKTVLMGMILTALDRFGAQIFCFDKGRGLEGTIRALGGDYHIMTPERAPKMNFLHLPDTQGDRAFVLEEMQILCCEDTPTARQIALLQAAINDVYELPVNERRLSAIDERISGNPNGTAMSERLKLYYGRGPYAWAFDHDADELTLAHAHGFDMTAVLKTAAVCIPMLGYIKHRINSRLDGTLTAVGMDEVMQYLGHPIFQDWTKDMGNTGRKQNLCVLFSTQSAKSIEDSPVCDVICEQTFSKAIFPNHTARHKQLEKLYAFTATESDIVKRSPVGSRTFVLKQGDTSSVLRLDMGHLPEHLRVLSMNNENALRMDALIAQHGPDPANWLAEFMIGDGSDQPFDFGVTHEEIS